jgi:hypothetical protein
LDGGFSSSSAKVSRAVETEARAAERLWTEDVFRRAESRLRAAQLLEKMGKARGALEFD